MIINDNQWKSMIINDNQWQTMIINDNQLISHEISLWDISVVQVSMLCQWYLTKLGGEIFLWYKYPCYVNDISRNQLALQGFPTRLPWKCCGLTLPAKPGKWQRLSDCDHVKNCDFLEQRKRVYLQQNGHNKGVASGVGRCLHFVLCTGGGLPRTKVFLIMSPTIIFVFKY